MADLFAVGAAGYAEIAHFWRHGERLVELAAPLPGAVLLDVACGRGAVLFAAANRVGRTGRAIGVDLADGMVRETAVEAKRRGLHQVEVHRMDAEELEFPSATFDLVTCGFALFFFPELGRALGEIRRVLKAGGRLAVSTWGAPDPDWSWWEELRRERGLLTSLRTHELNRGEELDAVLRAAGFVGIDVRRERSETVYRNAADFWRYFRSTTPRSALERLADSELARFRAAVEQELARRARADGTPQRQEVLFAVAGSPIGSR